MHEKLVNIYKMSEKFDQAKQLFNRMTKNSVKF